VRPNHAMELKPGRRTAYTDNMTADQNPKPAGEELRVPTDLRKAFAATPMAKAQWRGSNADHAQGLY